MTAISFSLLEIAYKAGIAAAVSYLLWIIYARTLHPLAKYPGPVLASITRAWIAWHVWRGDLDRVLHQLHQRYGRFVRIAPDEVTICDPSAVKIVYGVNSGFTKTSFYLVWRGRGDFFRVPDLFTETNPKAHGERRRIVNHLYSMNNIVQSEQYIENCVNVFMSKMAHRAKTGEVFNLTQWIHWYAFDVIGELYFSRMFGFLSEEEDHENWISALHVLLPVLAAIGFTPTYVRTLLFMSSLAIPGATSGLKALSTITKASEACVTQRRQEIAEGKETRNDLLQQMLEIEKEKGDALDFRIPDIQVEVYVALFAGSETTLFAISAALYELVKAPEILAKLHSELDTATKKGRIGRSSIGYNEASKLPYLRACIQETLRMHPSLALSFPRNLPQGGSSICGTYFPAGVRVGVSPFVMQRDESMFGLDANSFKPERWVGEEGKSMEKYMLTFGGGARTCIGKHIVMCEMYKLIPRFLREYDIELMHDASWEWKTTNYWITRPDKMFVKIKPRHVE